MVFNLCSSAGVHGVFVLDFFVGGPAGGEDILGSSPPPEEGPAPDGADIATAGPDARRLLRAVAGDAG